MPRKLHTWTYVGLFLIGLMADGAHAEFASNAEAARPLGVGEHAPDFTAQHADRSPYVFSGRHLERPYVLIFYRGGWCPYCNTQLSDLHLVEPKLRASGFEVLFISTDRPELLYSSLKNQNLPYTLVSDPGLEAAQAFHIAFHLDEQHYADQLKWGVDLEKTTGTKNHARLAAKRAAPSSAVLGFEITATGVDSSSGRIRPLAMKARTNAPSPTFTMPLRSRLWSCCGRRLIESAESG